jgi:hypothetical protein
MDTPVGLDPNLVPMVLDTGRKAVAKHAPEILNAVQNFTARS